MPKIGESVADHTEMQKVIGTLILYLSLSLALGAVLRTQKLRSPYQELPPPKKKKRRRRRRKKPVNQSYLGEFVVRFGVGQNII